MVMQMDRSWLSLDQPAAQAVAAADPVLVLPLGAVEQHGPHLPLGTDALIAEGLVAAACRHLDAADRIHTLPTLAVGASAEHASFPGTLSLSAGTLARMIEDIGASLAAAGIRRLVVCNAHGGNRAVLDTAALRLRRDHGMLVVKAHYFRQPLPPEIALPEEELQHGLHGGAIETALMLALHPERVRAEALAPARSLGALLESRFRQVGPEGANGFAWLAEDLHPSGAVGDATLATRELGLRLLDHYASALARTLEEALRLPLRPPGTGAGLIDRERLEHG